jgi:hypothetical protein
MHSEHIRMQRLCDRLTDPSLQRLVDELREQYKCTVECINEQYEPIDVDSYTIHNGKIIKRSG